MFQRMIWILSLAVAVSLPCACVQGANPLQKPDQTSAKPISNGWIDTHHHIVPDFYAAAVEAAGGDPTGWPTPKWTPASGLDVMATFNISKAIVSFTAPGATIVSGNNSRQLARQMNEYSSQLVYNDSLHFPGFFAALPSLDDVDGALHEIEYVFSKMNPVGVVLHTSYVFQNDTGAREWRYLGHPTFAPVFKALAKYNAVVFVHPSDPPTSKVNQYLLPPIVDYPQETTRTAADLILRGVVTANPSLRFILSHAGGTLPMLAQRIANAPKMPVSAEEIRTAVASFYYDVALSTSPAQLKALLEVTTQDHVLFGSDTPYAPNPAILSGFTQLKQLDKALLDKITYKNAQKLFSKIFKKN